MTETKPSFLPTILVILGITGDLAAKKIIPALFNLQQKNELPDKFHIIGFGRREWDDEKVRTYVQQVLADRNIQGSENEIKEFLHKFLYQSGNFDDAQSYTDLNNRVKRIDGQWEICSNKLFYLSVPPQLYANILRHLSSSGLTDPCSPEEGWTRVLVEKPFGKDLRTAEDLDSLLGELFKEEQIYRIDHYLAKEMVQNILTFRFSNDMFENAWDNRFIEKIDIRAWETLGVEKRGAFYDNVGALRDFGQNHLLQMLALVTMDHPHTFSAENIRTRRAKILETLIPPTEEQIKTTTFRAQYNGYRNIQDVREDSNIETYFRAIIHLNNPRWQNVPVTIETGKRMAEARKEMVVTFKHHTPCLCPAGQHLRNQVIISLEPEESIKIKFWVKRPGHDYQLKQEELNFTLRDGSQRMQYVEEYEKLLLDSIVGDQTLFVSTEEIKAMWKVTDPIIEAWEANKVPLDTYAPDTNEAVEKADKALSGQPANSKHHIGIIGLGKMGGNLALRMIDQGWKVHGWNRTTEITDQFAGQGLIPAHSIKELIDQLPTPRIVWLMLPAGQPTDDFLFGEQGVAKLLDKGDIVIDGANSYYKDAIRRAPLLEEKGLEFLDVGVSGGPGGARRGPSLMIGGKKEVFTKLEPLFAAMAQPNGYKFFEGHGAGHFVKMVHNGIEYGMMQALAEGFAIMKKVDYDLDLTQVAEIYNNGSVIESRLVGWMKDAFAKHGQDLSDVTSTVAHTGEGEWTVKTARELNIEDKVIEEALNFRIRSAENPSYTGKLLSALREQFGGHKA